MGGLFFSYYFNTFIFKFLNLQIPAVQKNLLTNDNTNGQQPNAHRVLTQLGAIRKQLQLEKMEMDQTILNHRH